MYLIAVPGKAFKDIALERGCILEYPTEDQSGREVCPCFFNLFDHAVGLFGFAHVIVGDSKKQVVSRQVVEIEFGASPYRASYPIAAISSSSGASSRGRSSSRMDSALK